MAEKKRKTRDEHGGGGKSVTRKGSSSNQRSKKSSKSGGERVKKGPRLPNALRKEIEIQNPRKTDSDDEDAANSDDDVNDFYEYEEAAPEEESKKNRRYDPVDDLQYEFSADKDDDIASDEGDIEVDSDEGEDEGRHARMLEGLTGLPRDAFEEKKRKRDVVITEAHPESEYNPSRSDGRGLSIQDLLDPLHGKPGFSKLRKSMERMEKKSKVTPAPLAKMDREAVEREVTYDYSKDAVTKYELLVKKNREASTIYFNGDPDIGLSTVGAIASEFEPRTDFEKKMALLVNDDELLEAHRKDGARLLELNKISVEDVKERQDRLAKMRNLLFRHELKAKRVKKIKSKTYHRLLKKDRLKAAANDIEMDPEAAKTLAMKQEFKRAQERLTLKHKNSSRWAKRILERGLAVQDEGTRAAIAEQLQQHALLTRKMKSMKDGSDSDESSDDDDDDDDDDSYAGSDGDDAHILEKAKKKTAKVLGEEDESPKSGLLSLPFMVRGMKKRKEAADEEAKLALQEFESSLRQLEDKDEADSPNVGHSSGRRAFGGPKKQHQESSNKIKTDKFYGNSDSEDDFEARDDVDVTHNKMNFKQNDVNIDPNSLRQASEMGHDPLFKSFEDIVKDPGAKTSYEVAIFASNSWKKKKNLPEDVGKIRSAQEAKAENSSRATQSDDGGQDVEEGDEGSDSDSEGHMVDGILSAETKYELPSQTDLIRSAFAGDDVEEEFHKDKQEILNEENPEPEKPVLLPGWGQWTDIQRKKGLPSWMLAEYADGKKKREEAVKKRKDAALKHVIITEKIDKKAEKLQTTKLPYPFTSKDVFEQSLRMPIGPESNPATAIGALIRPEVVKKSGLIIKPINIKDVNPHERKEDHKQGGQKPKNKSSGKASKVKNNKKGIKAK